MPMIKLIKLMAMLLSMLLMELVTRVTPSTTQSFEDYLVLVLLEHGTKVLVDDEGTFIDEGVYKQSDNGSYIIVGNTQARNRTKV